MEYEHVPGRLFVESRCRVPDLDLVFQPFLGRSSDTQPTTTAEHARWLLDILTSSPQYSSRLTGYLHLHSAGFILGELNASTFKTDNSDLLMHFCILLSRSLRSILLLSCLCPLHLSPKLFTLRYLLTRLLHSSAPGLVGGFMECYGVSLFEYLRIRSRRCRAHRLRGFEYRPDTWPTHTARLYEFNVSWASVRGNLFQRNQIWKTARFYRVFDSSPTTALY